MFYVWVSLFLADLSSSDWSINFILIFCVCLPIVMSNILSNHMSLRSEFRVVISATISVYKRCSIRLYPQLFVGGPCLYLCYLCSAVQYILTVTCERRELLSLCGLLCFCDVRVAHCFGFFCVVFLCCLSSSCVLCTRCSRFLWIVHSWLSLWRLCFTSIDNCIWWRRMLSEYDF